MCESSNLISHPLLKAVYKGCRKEFLKLIKQGCDINLQEHGWTSLLLATEREHVDIVEEVLKYISINIDCTIKGWTSLMLAAKNGNINIFQLLVENNANLNKNICGWDALKIACYFEQVTVVEYLLTIKNKIDLTPYENEWSHLHIASIKGLSVLVNELVNDTPLVEYRIQGWTPLMLASFYGHHNIVQLLVENGADINRKTYNGYSALLLALQNGWKEVVDILLSDESLFLDYDPDFLFMLCTLSHDAGLRSEIDDKINHSKRIPDLHMSEWTKRLRCHCQLILKILDNQLYANVIQSTYLFQSGVLGCEYMLQRALKQNFDLNTTFDSRTALMMASENRHYTYVKYLMSLNADINLVDENGWNALMFASNNGHKEVVKLLLISGADVNVQDKNGWTASMLAASNGFIGVVNVLKRHRADLTLKQKDGWNALMLAVYYERIKPSSAELLPFLEYRKWCAHDLNSLMIIALHFNHVHLIRFICYNISFPDFFSGNITPLMYAGLCGKIETFQLLITLGANINLSNKYGLTVLMCAELGGHDEIVRQIKNKANYVNHTKIYKWEEFIAAIHEQDAPVSSLIFEPDSFLPQLFNAIQVAIDMRIHGVLNILHSLCQPEYIYINGNDHLLMASSTGNHNTVLFLIQIKYDVNEINHVRSTALMLASQNGHLNVVQLLVESNADLNLKNYLGKTALMLALEKGQVHVVRYLISAGCDVNVIDMEGANALMLATEFGYIDIFGMLVSKQADIFQDNENGYDALMLAIKNNHFEIVSALLRNNVCIDEFRSIDLNYAPVNENSNISDSIISLKNVTADCQPSQRECYSPLMFASYLGHAESVQVLLEESFKISPDKHEQYVKAKNERGDNALTLALKYGHSNVAEVLLKDSTEYEEKEAWNVFKMLCEYNQYELLKKLVARWCCDFNKFNKKGLNVLMIAVIMMDFVAFKTLIKHGSNFACFHKFGINFESVLTILNTSSVFEANLLELIYKKVSTVISDPTGNTKFVLEDFNQHTPRTTTRDNKINLRLINEEGLNVLFIAAEDFKFDFMWILLLFGVEAQLADLYIWLRLIKLVSDESACLNNNFFQLTAADLATFIEKAGIEKISYVLQI
ncbi:ankyrin-3-like [Physella acuta]|uniref:ankyrin-3-like n=1 Tax=Physella acuta TaxID=109671 RepID=UPI0027DD888A|nr:ankyrin-3-like [Physella acuta]